MLSITDILDYILHHSEHKTLGQSGERFLYRELQRHGVSRKQMFRNVYFQRLLRMDDQTIKPQKLIC